MALEDFLYSEQDLRKVLTGEAIKLMEDFEDVTPDDLGVFGKFLEDIDDEFEGDLICSNMLWTIGNNRAYTHFFRELLELCAMGMKAEEVFDFTARRTGLSRVLPF